MKKVLILLAFLLGCSILSYAQTKMTDVVYLKNGSIIKGIIVEQVPNQSMKIKTSDGSIFNYQMNEIEKITKEENIRSAWGSGSLFSNSNEYNIKGVRGFLDLGYIAGGIKGPEFCFTLGYQTNDYLFIGAGVGIQYATDLETVAAPMYVDIRSNLMTGPVVPFIALRAGYELLTESEFDGGFYCHPFAGVKFMTGNRRAINLAIGWSTNKYKYDYSNKYGGTYTSKYKINALTLKIGYEF